MSSTVKISRVIRRGVLVFLTMALVGLSMFVLPAREGQRGGPAQAPVQGARLRRVSAQPSAELDTTADQVYGQPDFTTTEAPDPPDETTLNAPGSMAIYYSGQVFIADTGNNRVLIWDDLTAYEDGDPANVVIGQPDFTSNAAPNPPTASSLNGPTAVEWDEEGNLYVSDTGNNRVLVFEPEEGEDDFLTFTDGQAASVVLGQPDFTSNAALNPPTGASLNQPRGLALDYNDNLVVADSDNNRVLIFEGPLTTGMLAIKLIGHPRDVVGAPEATFGDFNTGALAATTSITSLNHPTGVAIGVAHDELYVADSGNHRVLVFTADPLDAIADYVIGQPDFESNTPNQGGVSAGSLNNPTGIVVDPGDRLFVADTGNHRVLEYDNPATSPVANQVFGQNGSFTTNTPNTGSVSEDSLNAPVGVTTDYYWLDIYIADQGNHRVLEYDNPLVNAVPKVVELYPGTVRAGSQEFELEIWGSGIIEGTIIELNGVALPAVEPEYYGLLTTDISAAQIAAVGSLTVRLINPAPGGGVSNPLTLAIYAPHPGDATADSVMGQAGFTSNWGEFEWVEAHTLLGPTDVAVDAAGRVFVLDRENWRVLSWPSALALQDGQDADLVIGQPNFGEQDWENPQTTAHTLLYPMAIALDNAGALYVADTAHHRVLVFQPPFSNGMNASLVIGQADFTSAASPIPPTAASLNLPRGVAVDSVGNLYVTDAENHRVLVFEAPLTNGKAASYVFGQGGDFTTAVANKDGLSANSLNYPMGLALDTADNLYIADSGNHRVLEYALPLDADTTADRVFGQGGSFTTRIANKGGVSADSLASPTGVTVQADNVLYIADQGNHRVLAYHAPLFDDVTADYVFGQHHSFTANQRNNGGLDADTLFSPWAVAVDAAGNLYVADANNNRVLSYLQPFTPAAPALNVFKSVDTGGLDAVPLGGTITYTLVISNSGDGPATAVRLTDTLPTGVTFGAWVEQGSAVLPVRWGPYDVAAGERYTLRFTAVVTTDVAFAGQTLVNTARFSAANVAQPGVAEASFTVEGAAPTGHKIYLPLVLRNSGSR